MDEPELAHVALHEAAHAVVAVHVGFEVFDVSVEPNATSLGRVTFVDPPVGHGGVLVSLAGPAINYDLGLLSGVGCDADAFDALDTLKDDDEFEDAFMETLELVRSLRPAIEVVAHQVIESGTIDGQAVRRLVGDTTP